MSALEHLADELERAASRLESDADLERRDIAAFSLLARAAPKRLSWTMSRAALATAAMILLGAGIWSGISWLSSDGPPRLSTGPLLADVRLSSSREPTRAAESPPRFHSGERVYLHYSLKRKATVFVALLDAGRRLSPVSDVAPRLQEGAHHVTLELDKETGLETLFLMAGAAELATEDFLEAIRAAGRSALPEEHTAAVQAILTALNAKRAFEVRALSYSHEPGR